MQGFFLFGSPMLKLSIGGRKIEMLLDTGFNGHLMLPQTIIDELALDQIGISDYVTASGEEAITKVYKAILNFFNEHIEVPVLSTHSDFSLVGMELFHDCKITIQKHKGLLKVLKSKKN